MTVDSPIDPLERALRDVASRVDISDLDGFTAATMARVSRGRDDARRRRTFALIRGSHQRQLLAVAAAILLIVSAVLAVPTSRDAIADLLGIEGLRIRTEESPTSSVGPPASSSPSSTLTSSVPSSVSASGEFDADAVGRALALGSSTTMSAARTALPAMRELTSTYGPPDAVYVGARPTGLVSFVWRARPGLAGSTAAPSVGLVVQQYPGGGGLEFFQKTVGGTSRVREVVVEGRKGYWVDGEPHSIAYVDVSGQYLAESVRWSSHALVWAKDGITHRIESSLSEAEVMALVSGLH